MDDRDASRVYEVFPDKSNMSYIQGVSTFTFRKRWGQVDWKKLASVDVDRIARDMDFQALQQNVMNIAFCNIQTEEFHNIDPNFVKLFRLAQLIIEYLLHSQQYLSNQSTSLHQKLLVVHQNLEKSVNDLRLRDEELKSIKKESRKRRKIIEAYQDMINAGATGLHSCPICKREFVSSEYLQSHIHRRHPNHFPMTENGNIPASQKPLVSQEVVEAKVMERVSERLLMSEKQLREEMKQKEEEIISLQLKEYEEWKLTEKERMSLEIETFKRPIIAQLEELQQEKGQLEKRLKETEVELLEAQSKRKSHLGQLEGARELVLNEANQLNESKAEIECLKEKMEIQMQEMQTALKQQDVSWKKKIQKLSASYHDQLTESIAKVEALEQSVLDGSRNDVQDQKLSKGLRNLQQKIRQQEIQLQSQQEQLALLQTSREPSPVQVHQNQDENFSESEDSSEDKGFMPFASRPMIKTKYDHDQKDMEKVRKQMQAIVSDTLVHNGLIKDSTRLKKEEFESKIKILDQEREKRTKAHYQFAEHRRRAEDTVNQIATTDYRPVSTHKLLQDTTKLSAAVAHKSVSKPPIPAPKILVSESGDAVARIEQQDKASNMSSSGLVSSSASDSESSRAETPPPPTSQQSQAVIINTDSNLHEQQGQPRPPKTMEDDNSWDSDASIEELFAPQRQGGRPSSTPVRIQDAHAKSSMDETSLNSFQLNSAEPVPAPKVDPPGFKQLKPHSRTATSQSALTSVSMEDFDSDFSDLNLSN